MSLESRERRLLKLVVCNLSLLIAVFFIGLSFPGQAKQTLYSAISPVSWGAFAIALVILSAIGITYDRQSTRVFGCVLGLLLVLYGGLYFLPESLGHVMYGSFSHDQLVHMGRIKDILANGEIQHPRYPGTYLLSSTLVEITDIEIRQLQYVLSFIFTGLFITAIYYCTVAITNEISLARVAAVVSLPLYFDEFQIGIMPWFFTFAFLPIILGATYKALYGGRNYALVVLTLIAAVSIFHPFTAALAVVMVGSITILGFKRNQLFNETRAKTYSAIAGLMFLSWQMYTGSFDSLIRNSLGSFIVEFSGQGVAPAKQVQRLGTADYSVLELIWNFLILEWGAVLLLLGLAALSIFVQALQWYWSGASITDLATVSIVNFMFGVSVAAFLIVINVTGFGPVRSNQYSIYFGIFLVALLIIRLHQGNINQRWPQATKIAAVAVCSLVIVSLLLSVGTVYESNKYIAQTDHHQAEWLLEEQNPDYQVYNSGIRNKYPRYYYGDELGSSKRAQGYLLANRTTAIGSFCTPNCSFQRFTTPAYFSSGETTGSEISAELYRKSNIIYSNGENRVYYHDDSR